jgi:murein L,D-transpeptidase YafK
MPSRGFLITLLLIFIVVFAIRYYATWHPTKDTYERVKALCESKGVTYPPENPKIIIGKSKRELKLYSGDIFLKSYRIALGPHPEGDKNTEGDGCTPEGVYYICTKNPSSAYHLFLGISYPNKEDARRGLENGIISESDYRKILTAIEHGKCPPWNTKMGGEIGIHGGGAKKDWTAGCIALENKDIEELYIIMEIGDWVTIME